MTAYFTDLNRDGGIGANSYLVELGSLRILIDTGMHPKKMGMESVPAYAHANSDPIDLIIVTHCHLDHLGSLPVAARTFPEAEILMSVSSAAIAPRMMRNSVQVMLRQRDEHRRPDLPLFFKREVAAIERRLLVVPEERPRTWNNSQDEVTITFFHSGHIPGSVSVRLEHEGRSLLFSGDILFEDQCILRGAGMPDFAADALVLETTRGLTARPEGTSRGTEAARLVEAVARVVDAGGRVLLPVFALGRMQEILSILRNGLTEGRLPACPVYASGLGMDLADYFDQIHRQKGDVHFSRRILRDLQVRPMPDGIGPGRLPGGAGIYVASSGMVVENTPSYRLAAALIEDPRNAVFFVGYCDPEAFGYQILSAKPGDHLTFGSLDHVARVGAEISRFDLSSHADREQLVDYARSVSPQRIFLSHGDPKARQWFTDTLPEQLPDCRITDPQPLHRYAIW